jgi:CRP-like cAMP-binding protein
VNLESSPFSADSAFIDALSERAVPVSCPEDRVLFRQGEECAGLFVLRSGHAILEMRSNTGEVVARFGTGDGSLLGLPAVFSGETYSLTAVAQQDSSVSFVERGSFLDLIWLNPALSLKMLQVIAAETRAARAALVDALSRQQLHKRSGNGSEI